MFEYMKCNTLTDMEGKMDIKIDLPAKINIKRGDHESGTGSTLDHVLVILTLAAFIAGVTFTNIYRNVDIMNDYGPDTEFILFVIGLIPYLSLPVTLFSCFGLILYNPYRKHKLLPGQMHLSDIPFLCFRIVTRGDMPKFVEKNAINNRNLCLSFGLEDFVVEIVSDKPIQCAEKNKIREIVVPESYTTKNNSMFKARALNYCLENHVNELAGNDWIVHLDEETLLTKDSMSGILHFIKEGNADIGQGPISYANGKVIKNWITTLADSVRLSLDYALFRFQFAFLNIPLYGFKGSYIVIRNNVEVDIGLDNGPDGSIAEDCYFALKAWSKGYKFGFITGEMHEKSPFTLMDFIRQRRRWFVGQTFTVLSEEIPIIYKLGILSSITSCMLMPLSLSNIYIDIYYPFERPFVCCILNGLVGGTFSFLYSFGVFASTSERKWSYLRRIFVSIFCCIVIVPFAAAMESVAAYWGLLTLNSKDFFIVQKEVPKRIKRVGPTKFM